MAGSPTLTTEPSIKARLEARMVVASTRRGWSERPPGRAAALATSQLAWVKLIEGLGPA